MNPVYYVKALVAALAAAQAAFVMAILPDSDAGTAVSVNEGIGLTFAAVIAGLGVYVASNKPDPNNPV